MKSKWNMAIIIGGKPTHQTAHESICMHQISRSVLICFNFFAHNIYMHNLPSPKNCYICRGEEHERKEKQIFCTRIQL